MRKLILIITYLPLIMGKLVIFQYKNDYIGNYLNYFSYIDNNIAVLKYNFTLQEYKRITKDTDGFIYPGGSSDIYNSNSKYWDYVNLSFNENKPIFGICNGFHHILKKLNANHPFDLCWIKTNLLINNKIHNHRWCTKIPPKNFNYKTFKYKNQTFIESIRNKRIYATVYHPEKFIQCDYKLNNCRKISDISIKDLVKFTKLLKCYH
jgi:imidazoleglycerol phosphate synthase glutamine amidotransferase subunit HisH